MSPFGPIQDAFMGRPQDIYCTVITAKGLPHDSVLISWTGPKGDSVINDSRLNVVSTTSTGKLYNSILHFDYLMEGDEGIYTCNVMILGTNQSQSFELKDLRGKENIHSYIIICY